MYSHGCVCGFLYLIYLKEGKPVERLGFIGIIVEDRTSAKAVNEILSAFGDIIRGRMGVPDQQTGDAVIGVVVKGTNEQLGAMTGRLGNLKGVQVKSALASPKNEKTKGMCS